tara:strand:+ start:566 stop:874 length:309 start_codon:yes stop_codon:yes gene_type:complete
MSRPKPNVLLEKVDKITYKADQVLASDGIWSVFFKEKPINLKSHNILTSYPGPKYKKVSFSNPGHAINLCKKLNIKFQTQEFTVVILSSGKTVFPPLTSDAE